jgi:RNA polymerase sigma-70 factor (ECF subfamily)
VDEARLLERLRAGDEAAFAELVDRYDGPLRRLARTFVRTDAQADDVVQETWLGVVRGLDRFEGRASLKTWLFRILVNRARTRAVREARSTPFSSLRPQDDEPAVDPDAFGPEGMWLHGPGSLPREPDSDLLAGELREKLLAAVDQLPEAQKTVITLRDIAGLDGPEVAAALGITDGNQRILLHRARARVRRELAGYVEGGS